MRLIVLLALLVFLVLPTQSATLRLGTPQISNNQYHFPVYLQGDAEGVAALDFRLSYDPAVFSPVSAHSGASAASAQKQVSSNVASPGEFVVVMMGFNQNAVAPGEVIKIVLEKIHEPEGGQSVLRIAEPTMATVDGTAIDSRGLTRTVQFGQPKDKENDESDSGDEDEHADSDDDTSAGNDNDEEAGPLTRLPGGVPFLVAGSGSATEKKLGSGTDTAGISGATAASGETPGLGVAGNGHAPLPGMAAENGLPTQTNGRPRVSTESGRSGGAPDLSSHETGATSHATGEASAARPGENEAEIPTDSLPPDNSSFGLVLLLGLAPVGLFVVYKVLAR